LRSNPEKEETKDKVTNKQKKRKHLFYFIFLNKGQKGEFPSPLHIFKLYKLLMFSVLY